MCLRSAQGATNKYKTDVRLKKREGRSVGKKEEKNEREREEMGEWGKKKAKTHKGVNN